MIENESYLMQQAITILFFLSISHYFVLYHALLRHSLGVWFIRNLYC